VVAQNMGLLSIQPVPFELSGKISEVISMFSVECQQKAVKLSMRKADSIVNLNAEWIEADPGRIAQVLLNLISNALKVSTRQSGICVHE
jgi:signal transduction histidine kinase